MTTWTNKELKDLRNNPNDYPTDDMLVSLASAKLHPSATPSWEDGYDWGIGGGVEFPVLSFSEGNAVYFALETSHTMKINDWLDIHVHGTLPTNDAGKKVKWQVDVIAAGIGEAWSVPEGSPYTHEFTLKGAEADRHNMLDLADIPPMNSTVSTIYQFKLTRIAPTSDPYGEDIYLIFADCHYRADSSGSYFEGAKLTEEYAKQKGTPKNPFKPGAW